MAEETRPSVPAPPPGRVEEIETKVDVVQKLNIPDNVKYGVGLRPAPPDENVRRLQQYIEDNTPEDVLPKFGVDGRWGPETQKAFDEYVKLTITDFSGSASIQDVLDAANKQQQANTEVKPSDSNSGKIASTAHFQDQCFLLSNLKNVIEKTSKTKEDRAKIKYSNIHLIQTEDPSTIMNKLYLSRYALDMMDIRHWELSSLSPTIRVYKQYYPAENPEPKEIEIKFNSFVDPITDLQSMLNSQMQRGVGVGIESFSWDLIGVQPATATKDIKAKLVIKAASFNELFKVRTAVDQHGEIFEDGYRIIDLVLLQPKNIDITEEDGQRRYSKRRKFNPKYYEVKVVVGWAPQGRINVATSDQGSSLFGRESTNDPDRPSRLADSLKENLLSLILTVVDHEFDFSDDGSVTLTIDFRARTESIMLNTDSDILASREIKDKRKEIEDFVLSVEKGEVNVDTSGGDKGELVTRLRKTFTQNIQKQKELSYRSLLETLTKNDKVYVLQVTTEDIQNSSSDEPVEGGTGTSIEEGTSELAFRILDTTDISVETKTPTSQARNIPFIFLGDLIDVAYNNILLTRYESEKDVKYKNMKLVLGNIIIDNPDNNQTNFINESLANLPVSVELFTDFMNEKLVSKGFETYPFLIFIRDVIRSLIIEVVSKYCMSGTSNLSLVLDTAQISADSLDGNVDPIESKLDKETNRLNLDNFSPLNSDNKNFVFNSFNSKPSSEKYNYFVIYAFDKEPKAAKNVQTSLYDYDYSRGIFHLTTGLDRGLVKSMSFRKTTQRYLREARYMEVESNPDLQLSNVYDVEIDMFGNNLFIPGSQIFINPRGLGSGLRSDELGDPTKPGTYSNIMGLGGYHVVKKVTNVIDKTGRFVTKVDALFTSSGDGKRTNHGKNSIISNNIVENSTISSEQAISIVNQLDSGDELAARTSGVFGSD